MICDVITNRSMFVAVALHVCCCSTRSLRGPQPPNRRVCIAKNRVQICARHIVFDVIRLVHRGRPFIYLRAHTRLLGRSTDRLSAPTLACRIPAHLRPQALHPIAMTSPCVFVLVTALVFASTVTSHVQLNRPASRVVVASPSYKPMLCSHEQSTFWGSFRAPTTTTSSTVRHLYV